MPTTYCYSSLFDLITSLLVRLHELLHLHGRCTIGVLVLVADEGHTGEVGVSDGSEELLVLLASQRDEVHAVAITERPALEGAEGGPADGGCVLSPHHRCEVIRSDRLTLLGIHVR